MLFITHPQFHTTAWQQALPDAKILTYSDLPNSPEARKKLFSNQKLVLLLSHIPDWETLMNELQTTQTNWMVLSRNTNQQEFRKILAAGARGYLDALSHPDSIKLAVKSVASGALWIPDPFMSQLVQSISAKLPQRKTPDLSCLSPKEIEVAKLISTGTANKQIAEQLHVTERTIKSHLTQIYNKLNIRDRMQLMLYMQGHPVSHLSQRDV